METAINHWCKICGVGYHACNDCDSKKLITWRAVACTPEHFQAYTVLHEYDGSEKSKQTARQLLEPLIDMKSIGEYPEVTRRLLTEIFADNAPAMNTNFKQKQKQTNTVKKKQSVGPKNE